MNTQRGSTPRKWSDTTRATGKNNWRSSLVRFSFGVMAVMPSFWIMDISVLSSADIVLVTLGAGGRPLRSHNAIAMIVKLTATSIALGR